MGKGKKKKNDIVDNTHSQEGCESLLKSADKEIMPRFKEATRNIQIMAWVNIGMEIIVFVVAIIAIVFGIKSALDEVKYMGVYIAIAGLIMLLSIAFRNPLNGVQRALSNLAKIQIIFHGYVRQIIQIDTAYKQTVFSGEAVDLQEMLKAIYNIQEAVEQSVDEVSRSVEE